MLGYGAPGTNNAVESFNSTLKNIVHVTQKMVSVMELLPRLASAMETYTQTLGPIPEVCDVVSQAL